MRSSSRSARRAQRDRYRLPSQRETPKRNPEEELQRTYESEHDVNVTILNGALPGDPFTDALAQRTGTAYTAGGAHVTLWRLRDVKAAYCLGCFQCWTHTPGECRIDDDLRTVTASIIRADLQVNVSPVTFGGYSSEIKKALDRSICLVMPFFTRVNGEVHHVPRYDRFPRVHAIGVLSQPDAAQEDIFRRLVERNAINMHAPAHSTEFVYRGAGATGADVAHQERQIA